MNNFFIIQVIISFVVGGALITFLSFIAEKTGEKVSGIIITIPSTAILGFFFLGWTLDSQTVANIAPTTFIPLGVSILFAAIYLYIAQFLAKFRIPKSIQIIISIVVSTVFWLTLSIPFAIYKFTDVGLGIVGFGVLIFIAHTLFRFKKRSKAVPAKIKYTTLQKLGRAVFVGSIIAIIIILGNIINPFWGGIFTMFPAATSSVLVIFHWYYGAENLLPFIKKMPIGSLSLIIYTLTVINLFPIFGFVLGTIAAFFTSLAVSLLLVKAQKYPFSAKRLDKQG